jgi:hypothetical protein
MVRVTAWLALAAGIALVPMSAPASDGPVARPDVREGDRWIYRRMNYAQRRATGDYEVRVTFAGPNGIVAVATDLGNKTEADTTWTAEWNAAVAANGDSYTPDTQTFRFPLAVGSEWPSAFELRRPHAMGYGLRFNRTAKVLGWEEIEVPAGRHRALRVQIEGPWERVDVRASGRSTTTMWYAPVVKRWVKYEYRDTGVGAHFGEELVRFLPAP